MPRPTAAIALFLLYWLSEFAHRDAAELPPPCGAGAGGRSLADASAAALAHWTTFSEAALAGASAPAFGPWIDAIAGCRAGGPSPLAAAALAAGTWAELSAVLGEAASAGVPGLPRLSRAPGGALRIEYGPVDALVGALGGGRGAACAPLDPAGLAPLVWSELARGWGDEGPGSAAPCGPSRAAAADFVADAGGTLAAVRARVAAAVSERDAPPAGSDCFALALEASPWARERWFYEGVALGHGADPEGSARAALEALDLWPRLRRAAVALRVAVPGAPGLEPPAPAFARSLVSLAAAHARSRAAHPGWAHEANAFFDPAGPTLYVMPALFFPPGAGPERLRLAVGHEVGHLAAAPAPAGPCDGAGWPAFLARFPGEEAFADWVGRRACGAATEAACDRAFCDMFAGDGAGSDPDHPGRGAGGGAPVAVAARRDEAALACGGTDQIM